MPLIYYISLQQYRLPMEQEQDLFSVFKRPNNDSKTQAGTVEKKSYNQQSSQPPVDSIAILESNLIKETLLQPIQEHDEEDQDPLANRYKLDPIEIQMFREQEGCLHQVYTPKGYTRTIYEGPLNARKYQFELDDFQKKAVRAIESNESVLVCAHTSAGKTAVAEYAIQLSKDKNSRVIYTSPIKALSNQKYRDLKKDFEDVGLITGDVTIDPESSCLVMTTEILRSMIYRGSEIIRQVRWVIFDEIHYMRDKERGVVWEEAIILLPEKVRLLFLSATIGNPGQFARWITKLKRSPCNVVYRDFRPVPLEHYLCPSRSDGIYLVVDQKGKFLEDNFYKAIEKLGDNVDVVGISKKQKGNNSGGADLSKLIKLIMEKKLEPVIVFSFNKRDIEAYAMSMIKFDFNTRDQKDKIREIYKNAVNVLSEQDRKLPQITSIISILERGIGIHHGGLLPLIKELIEILFQEGFIKCLFSTETFSMGLNMPARTVVFTSIRKFDGEQNRWIGGGEYIQMSGRAGRRGKDSKGVTILMIDQKLEPEVAKTILKGHSDDLLSSFYINYNMMLNSLRLEDIHPQYIVRRSFLQFQSEEKLPKLMQTYKEKYQAYEELEVSNMAEVEKLYYLVERANEYKEQVRKITMKPTIALNYLNLGRIVRIKDKDTEWGYGMVVNFHERKDKNKGKKNSAPTDEPLYLIDIMVYINERKTNEAPTPADINNPGQLTVLTFTLTSIYEITTLIIGELPADITMSASKKLIHDTIKKILERKTLPIIELAPNNPTLKEIYKLLKKVETERAELIKFEQYLPQYAAKKKMYQSLKEDLKVIQGCSSMVLSKEKKAMERVLRRTGMIEKNVVTLKGSVGCEISSNHEILLTHLLFSGFFSSMDAHEIAAVLSSIVHDERSGSDKKITPQQKLNSKYQELLLQAKSMYQIFSECKVQIEQQEYLESIKEAMIDATYSWCKGASFEEICKMSDCYEGSIIRTLRRLDELLKQMGNACKVIGNEDLQQKFSEASESIKRGIVFAASLHL